MSVPARDRLIVALDQPDRKTSWKLVKDLGAAVSFYKVGWVSLLNGGRELVENLGKDGKQVFLDLKIFDVPQTVEGAVRSVADLGVRFTTVHGNRENISAAVRGRGQSELKILAVTALTSLSEGDVRQLYGVPDDVTLSEHVVKAGKRLVGYGCDGVIASPWEIAEIRAAFPDKVLIVAPGIRLEGESPDDHKRPGLPYESIKAGADYVVVGRSIYRDPDPRSKVERYVEEINRGLADGARI